MKAIVEDVLRTGEYGYVGFGRSGGAFLCLNLSVFIC